MARNLQTIFTRIYAPLICPLDLHCKSVPTVNIHMIEHKVFKVYKSEEL